MIQTEATERSAGIAGLAAVLVLFLVLAVAPCAGQPSSRSDEIRQARRERAAELEPEELTKTEARLNKLIDSHLIERLTVGFHGITIVWGGLPVGQGFAVGPQYFKPDLARGALKLRSSARATTGKGLLLDLQLSAPNLAGEKMFVDFLATHRNVPRLEYFGQGPDSNEADRSEYRLEDTSFDFTVGFRPFKYKFSRPFSLGATGGYLKVNTGPGGRDFIAEADETFPPAAAPGLNEQTNFLRGGFFAQYDYRDNPLGPRRGGVYEAKFVHYDDRDLMIRDHRRLELEAQQYIPFWNNRRVIALRVASTMTYTSGDSRVPLYLQPTIGGSYDLRGFRAYRFYGNNSIIANVEYRFEAFTGLDAAIFFDAGKATDKRSQVNFHDLEASVGFGLRFNVQNSVFMRFDVGFSHEAMRLWLTFDNVF